MLSPVLAEEKRNCSASPRTVFPRELRRPPPWPKAQQVESFSQAWLQDIPHASGCFPQAHTCGGHLGGSRKGPGWSRLCLLLFADVAELADLGPGQLG